MIVVRSLPAPLLALTFAFACDVSIPKHKRSQVGAAVEASTRAHAASSSAAGSSATAHVTSVATLPTGGAASGADAPSPSSDQLFRVPVGPIFTILPGEGIGPIRFGATLQTIQRLMEAQCTEVAERDGLTWCRYQAHAVEFGLDKGRLVQIHIHGSEREFTPGKGLGVDNVYGIFHGKFANNGQLGMYRQYAAQGEPLRIEEVTPGRYPVVEKHYYDDMVLEFDKLRNDNIVLGGVVLTKPSKTRGKTTKTKTKATKSRVKPPIH